ncbi:hypothetical protein BGX26_000808 [Mortierella sp. AD094]|nr:hypothetical protein BGX26_000808 [Mortierella sp. AD094]
MTKSGSLTIGAPRPSSAEGIRITIQVHNDTSISVNEKSIPITYGTPECLAIISGNMTLETDKECTGDEFKVVHSATASYRTPVRQPIVPDCSPFD